MTRRIWTIDEYMVVADLYLRRRRSSGVRDPEVIELARLTGRTPASISRRLGNFDGTERPGKGLKPVTAEALTIFRAMQADRDLRRWLVGQARDRLAAGRDQREAPKASRRLVPPERILVQSYEAIAEAEVRRMQRAEAQLVRRYCKWIDPEGDRLRGVVISADGHLLRGDLYDTKLNLLIEAKAEASRNHIRHAIGQLFDYRRYFDAGPSLAVLVPSRPTVDLMNLLSDVGIQAIWLEGRVFVDSVGGRYVNVTSWNVSRCDTPSDMRDDLNFDH